MLEQQPDQTQPVGRAVRAIGLLLVLSAACLLLLARPAARLSAADEHAIESPDTEGSVGFYTSLALDAAGYPVISYFDADNEDLKIIHCNDPNCAGGDESIEARVTQGAVGRWTSLALDANGFPVVSFYDSDKGDLKLLLCNDPDCAGIDTLVTLDDSVSDVGKYNSLALDSNGIPVVSYYDATDGNLKLARCSNPNCAGTVFTKHVLIAGDTGLHTSLALDDQDRPVISFYRTDTGRHMVLRCGDTLCVHQEPLIAPDQTELVGTYSSLVLDAAGLVVVSYYDEENGDLKILRCHSLACKDDAAVIRSPDTGGDVGRYTSLALDVRQYPVVSYWDVTQNTLKVLHCDDLNCEPNRADTIAMPDDESAVGWYTSLALDRRGNPVVSYHSIISADLKLLHCATADCLPLTQPTDTPTVTPTATPSATAAVSATPTPTATLTGTPTATPPVRHYLPAVLQPALP